MQLYLIRHADPIYVPDTLTIKGRRQASALAQFLLREKPDRIFSSTSGRAKLTAQYTCDLLNMTPEPEDWMNEKYAIRSFCVCAPNGKRAWVFGRRRGQMYLPESESTPWDRWYDAPACAGMAQGDEGFERIKNASDEFLSRLGLHREGERYRASGTLPDKVAAFCHQGFGLTWLACLLSLPPTVVWRGMNLTHTGVTVLRFAPDEDGLYSVLLERLSDTAHLYLAEQELMYNNKTPI